MSTRNNESEALNFDADWWSYHYEHPRYGGARYQHARKPGTVAHANFVKQSRRSFW